jgi:glycine cleavage system pyridoxal-binding protein P
VTNAAAKKAGLKWTRQPPSVMAGLSGGCTEVDSHYMVPVVDGDDKVQTMKAMGVSHIMTLEATDVPASIKKRFSQARGYGNKLERPAKDVELLIGMDN